MDGPYIRTQDEGIAYNLNFKTIIVILMTVFHVFVYNKHDLL